MDIGTISSRYAKALFSLAKEKGQETRVYDDMKMLADSFSLEPELRVALGNPLLPAEEKLKLLTAAGGIEVSELYGRFMQLVVKHKRESLLLFMAHTYIQLYRKDKRITRVQFDTAVPVSEEVKEHLQNKLKEETGNTIEFSGLVQPELLGGFRLRIGNNRIDASYATQLREIHSRLLENR
ncbi:MAG: F0F1 ATP synthase subunit delta [Parabacteroides sp.]|nr:F0F1 ATP synthase subunit delta [Parabacteroides sp.]